MNRVVWSVLVLTLSVTLVNSCTRSKTSGTSTTPDVGSGDGTPLVDSGDMGPELSDTASQTACPSGMVDCQGCKVPCDLGGAWDATCSHCLDQQTPASPLLPVVGLRLGLSIDVPHGTDAKTQAWRAWMWNEVEALGVRVVRHDVIWAQIEPVQGQFSWTAEDETVAALKAHQIRGIGLLSYGNLWASKYAAAQNDTMVPPDNPQDFADFAAAAAARYAGQLDDWEVWNEQNAGYRFWKDPKTLPSGNPKTYAALLLATGKSIHEVAPQARVAFGGLFYLPQAIIGAEVFTQQALAAEPTLGDHIDALAYHPYAVYPPHLPPEASPTTPGVPAMAVPLDQTADRLQGVLQNSLGHTLPLWITEVGWPQTEDTNTAQQIAQYLLRSWALALSRDVQALCWYTIMDQDPSNDNYPWEKSFGLYSFDTDVSDGSLPQPKPAALALRAMHRVLGAYGFAESLAGRSSARHHLVFARPDGPDRVHVLWDETAASPKPAMFWPRSAHSYRMAEALDPPEDVTAWAPVALDAQGHLTVQVGQTPVYVQETPE